MRNRVTWIIKKVCLYVEEILKTLGIANLTYGREG